MLAHREDLRAAVRDLDQAARDALVDAIANDWKTADLGPADAALCAYAEKLTRDPSAAAAEDLATLREHGFGDRAIHEAIQVVAYFNYMNRVADAVHVDLEPEMEPYPT